MLIQIVDPCSNFPLPAHDFKEIQQFEFLDTEDHLDEFGITDEQAADLVTLLQYALDNRMNVIVHCHAGICRSGAVVEVAKMMGFDEFDVPRIPNLLVKKKMMHQLGWGYA